MLKIKGLSAEDLNGFMDEGTEFLGELHFRNTFRIDGHLKGKVISENTLIVGESGRVDAEIQCGVVSVKGRVTGRIQARDRVEILAGARVEASLAAPKLVIEEGAFFQGSCDMSGANRPAVHLAPRAAASGSGTGPS
jgi:cytoskeletal protein CcmA (bactofilin family)